MTCGEVRNKMDVMRAGALPESERAGVASHFAGCSTCRVLYAANVGVPGGRRFSVYSPLLLVAGLSLGATVLENDRPGRCHVRCVRIIPHQLEREVRFHGCTEIDVRAWELPPRTVFTLQRTEVVGDLCQLLRRRAVG